jgi:hypothetical protein
LCGTPCTEFVPDSPLQEMGFERPGVLISFVTLV